MINLYSTKTSRMVKFKNVHKLCQDIENDPIIKDQMVDLSCLSVCAFGNVLAPVLVIAYTINNLDDMKNEGHESD